MLKLSDGKGGRGINQLVMPISQFFFSKKVELKNVRWTSPYHNISRLMLNKTLNKSSIQIHLKNFQAMKHECQLQRCVAHAFNLSRNWFPFYFPRLKLQNTAAMNSLISNIFIA